MESNDTLEIIRSQFASKDKMSIDYYVNNILEDMNTPTSYLNTQTYFLFHYPVHRYHATDLRFRL
mgnify:CR=1 FL=1